jgi:hypothetical protein
MIWAAFNIIKMIACPLINLQGSEYLPVSSQAFAIPVMSLACPTASWVLSRAEKYSALMD